MLLNALLMATLTSASAAGLDVDGLQAHFADACAWPGEDPVPDMRLVKVQRAAHADAENTTELVELLPGGWRFRGQDINGARGLAAAIDADEEAEAEKGVTLGSGATEAPGTAYIRIAANTPGRDVATAAKVLAARGYRNVHFVGQAYQVPLKPTMPPNSPLRQVGAELASSPDDATRSAMLMEKLLSTAETACSGAQKEVEKLLVPEGTRCANLGPALKELAMSCPNADLVPFASWALAGTHPTSLYTSWKVRLMKPPLNESDVSAKDRVLLGDDEPWSAGHVRVLAKDGQRVHLQVAKPDQPLDGSKPKKKKR